MTKNNMKKLAVGVENVAHLVEIQTERKKQLGYACAYTTMKPTKEDELIKDGSLYWIIKGKISARQKILGFQSYIDFDEKKRTIILLDETVIETEKFAHRPFQGWRYLADNEKPADLDKSKYAGLDSDKIDQLSDLGIL